MLLHDQRHSKVPAYDRCTAFNQQVCFRTFGDRWRSQLQLMPMMPAILGCKIWSITGFRQASRIRVRCRLQVKKAFQLMLMMRAQCLGSTCRLASESPGTRIQSWPKHNQQICRKWRDKNEKPAPADADDAHRSGLKPSNHSVDYFWNSSKVGLCEASRGKSSFHRS